MEILLTVLAFAIPLFVRTVFCIFIKRYAREPYEFSKVALYVIGVLFIVLNAIIRLSGCDGKTVNALADASELSGVIFCIVLDVFDRVEAYVDLRKTKKKNKN